MKKHKNDEEQRSSHSMKAKVVSFPTEILEDILSRLPVKSILRSRSVSKTWLNLLSHPSFNKLHFTRATTTHRRTGFIISAYDYKIKKKRYYFSAGKDGGPLTLLMTVDNDYGLDMTGPSHLNGLICFTNRTCTSTFRGRNSVAFVVNPATRKVFKLPDMNSPCDEYMLLGYLYGSDESRNEHKILLIKKVFETQTFEFMIFSTLSYSWRKIDAEPPVVGFDWERLGGGVCVNSVVHLMLKDMSYDILAFDFVTEKFSVISIPEGVLPTDANLYEGMGTKKVYRPAITKNNGCLGVVLHDQERSEYGLWLLQDYEKRVWVKETIKFPEPWNDIVPNFPLSIDVYMDDEIVFCWGKVTENGISIPVYNMKTKCFRFVQFTLDHQFASFKSVSFCQIGGYVETIMPLVDNWSNKSHEQSD